MDLSRKIEAALFASLEPLTLADLARLEDGATEADVAAALAALRAEYATTGRAVDIVEVAGGVQLRTRPEFAPVLARLDTVPEPGRLSAAALETLAVIAYHQPISRAQIEAIRGVGCGAVLRTLLDRELITVVGRGDGVGRPSLYGTTTRFLEHFGFRSLDDLPPLEGFDAWASGDGGA